MDLAKAQQTNIAMPGTSLGEVVPDVTVSVENLRAVAERVEKLVERFQGWHDRVKGFSPAPPVTPPPSTDYDNGLNGALQKIRDDLCKSCANLETLLDSTTQYI